MRSWNLLEIEAPDGTRDPVVLHSDDEGRAVLVHIHAGQRLGMHQVKERAWICVVEGSVQVEADGDAVEAGAGMVLTFDPDERRSLSSEGGARVLLLLTPWPGEGHYRGGDGPASR